MPDASPFFISVVIVNYNGVGLLETCMASLAAQTYGAFETVLVDNASSDRSVEFVRNAFPQVKVVQSEKNVGFAAGNNLGIRAARGDLIATLNTDTRVEPEYLEKLSAPLRAVDAQRVGACAALMLEMERPAVVDTAGIEIDRAGMAWNRGAGQPAALFQVGGLVYGACAGAALYRRAMLDDVGSFDDAYFAFYEDADLAWRARKRGWQSVFVPEARVYHLHGASFGRISPRKTFLLTRNRWWTIRKNYPRPALWWNLPLIVLADVGSLIRAAGRGHLREAWAGRREGWGK